MIITSKAEPVFDFSDGQTWWEGFPFACAVCPFETILQPSDPGGIVIMAYSFHYPNGGGTARGRGLVRCPGCGYDIAFTCTLAYNDMML